MPHMEGIFINGEKAKFHPEDILDTDASQYTEEIGESVTAYLTEHLTNPSNPPIDTSLSIAGAAADAKETGDQISQLKSEFTALDATVYTNILSPEYGRRRDGFYINSDLSKIGTDSGNGGFLYNALPNTTYVLHRNGAVGIIGICCTDDTGAGSGTPVTAFSKSRTEETLTITTGANSKDVFVYAPIAYITQITTVVNYPVTAITNKTIAMERGALPSGKTSWSMTDHVNNVRSAYTIKICGAKYVSIADASAISAFTYVIYYFYDSAFNLLSYTQIDTGSVPPSPTKIVVIPDSTVYLRVVVNTAEYMDKLDVLFYGAESDPVEMKNPKARTDSEWITFDVSNSVYSYERMLLPPNYTIDGAKLPVIIWMDGSGNMTEWGSDFASDKLPYLRYLRDEGFAVISVFGWGSNFIDQYPNCGKAYNYPTPTNIKCLTAGIRWACDRYNLDYDNIHVMSKSQGGQMALYCASHQEFPIKSIGMFSPVLDYLSMPGEALYADSRKALYDDMGLAGDKTYFGGDTYLSYSDDGIAFWAQNKEQLCQLNEAWTNLVGGTLDSRFTSAFTDSEKFWTGEYWKDATLTDIYTNDTYAKIAKVPVKIWGASDDAQTPYLKMIEVVKQLQNGGCEAIMRTFSRGTGGHSCADTGSNVIASVTTALGITYTDVRTGWVENVEWIRLNMAK